MVIRRLLPQDERSVRRHIMLTDPDLAFHRQVSDYFLTESKMFGSMGVFSDTGAIENVIMFSRYFDTTLVHYTTDGSIGLTQFLEEIGYPAQVFLKDPWIPEGDGWTVALRVTPGHMEIDNPIYDGVFSRVAPRFSGAVYEHD